ncbi:AbrB/MazE/SpoVT family DNA-binding domain-containing protein [Alicyclobacillus sp. SO9]|nr:AbrB/MazE/SpoVT family DNA-binding domain-containing protein [Alicyclobacillus sp. SO9]
MFGTTKVGERGQIVIPKEAREKFDIQAGDSLFVIGDEEKQGLAIVKADLLEGFALQILQGIGYFNSNDESTEGDGEESGDSEEATNQGEDDTDSNK